MIPCRKGDAGPGIVSWWYHYHLSFIYFVFLLLSSFSMKLTELPKSVHTSLALPSVIVLLLQALKNQLLNTNTILPRTPTTLVFSLSDEPWIRTQTCPLLLIPLKLDHSHSVILLHSSTFHFLTLYFIYHLLIYNYGYYLFILIRTVSITWHNKRVPDLTLKTSNKYDSVRRQLLRTNCNISPNGLLPQFLQYLEDSWALF